MADVHNYFRNVHILHQGGLPKPRSTMVLLKAGTSTMSQTPLPASSLILWGLSANAPIVVREVLTSVAFVDPFTAAKAAVNTYTASKKRGQVVFLLDLLSKVFRQYELADCWTRSSFKPNFWLPSVTFNIQNAWSSKSMSVCRGPTPLNGKMVFKPRRPPVDLWSFQHQRV
jgi:hypothetical protein